MKAQFGCRVTGDEAACKPPCERLPEHSERAMSRTGRDLRTPVFELDPVQRVGVTVAERSPCVLQRALVGSQRRRVEGAAVLVDEDVEELVHGRRAVRHRDRVAATERLHLVDFLVEPCPGGGACLEASATVLASALVGPPGLIVARAALDDRSALLAIGTVLGIGTGEHGGTFGFHDGDSSRPHSIRALTLRHWRVVEVLPSP